MATPNYNLPTISGNMTADVVRDMNALAEATDSAIKEAVDNVDLSAVDTKISTHLADDVNHIRSAVDTGTANAKVVTLNPVPTVYKDLMGITFKNAVQNTGAVTINVNGLGAKSIIKSNGTALSSGFLKANSIYTVRYNTTTGNFILQGEGSAEGNVTPDKVLSPTTYTDPTTGNLTTGTMPNKGAPTITPTTSDQAIAPGYYSGGTIKAYQQERIQSSITIPSGGKAYVPQPWGNGTVGAYNGRVLSVVSQGRTSAGYGIALAWSMVNREPSYLASSQAAGDHSVTLDNTNVVFSSGSSNSTFDYVLTKYTGA